MNTTDPFLLDYRVTSAEKNIEKVSKSLEELTREIGRLEKRILSAGWVVLLAIVGQLAIPFVAALS